MTLLTQSKLERITEKETGFRNTGPKDTYADRLRDATAYGLSLVGLDGSQGIPRASNSRYLVYLGNGRPVPFVEGGASTIGAVIVVDDENLVDDPGLMGHEYFHVMQYAGTPGYSRTWLYGGSVASKVVRATGWNLSDIFGRSG